jgi:uncharacterized membrane protein YgaE (UPF0421/DUF939 family)
MFVTGELLNALVAASACLYACPMRLIDSLQTSSRSSLLQVLKTSVAAIVSWLFCVAVLGEPLPIFAAIAALLVVQPSVNQSFAKGVERSVGVIAGVILAYLAGRFFGHASWIVLGIIVLSLLLAWALRLSPGSANQIPISAMLVLAIGANTPDYAVNRIIETIIGAAIGLIVNVIIVPPVLLGPAGRAVEQLAESVASTLSGIATALRTPQSQSQLAEMLTQSRTLRTLQAKADSALQRADESLMLNPRRGRYRAALEHDRALNLRLGVLVTRAIGMARALHDRYDPALATDPLAASIARELERAAHDLLLLTHVSSPANAAPVELPTLTAPLVVLRPGAENWILVGSLLEDLRRVREEIIGAGE